MAGLPLIYCKIQSFLFLQAVLLLPIEKHRENLVNLQLLLYIMV